MVYDQYMVLLRGCLTHRSIYVLIIACYGFLSIPFPLRAQTPPPDLAQPVPIILDSDMASDINDAMVFAQLYTHMQQGEARLVAVVTNVSDDYSAPAVRALNAWHGHTIQEIPIGAAKDSAHPRPTPFTKIITDEFGTPGDSRVNYPDALTIYRHGLASQPDGTVVILSVGFLNNLAQLLNSPVDGISPLTGRELIVRKVRRLVLMGGEYPVSYTPEHNFKTDPAAASTVMASWPTEIIVTGYSMGASVFSGIYPTRNPATDPFARIWELTTVAQTNGKRQSWDTLTLLAAVRGLTGYFSAPGIAGINTVNPANGANTWTNPGGGTVTYLGKIRSDTEFTAILETLANEPPRTPTPTPRPEANSACSIDTRVYYPDPSIRLYIDRVTVGGKQFNRLQSAGWSVNDLTQWSLYTSSPDAPCFGKSTGQCVFTTRVAYINASGILNESMTVQSSYYDWNNTTGWRVVNHDLASVARYRLNTDAPCYGTAAGTCAFTARTVLYRQGTSVYDEFITVGPKYFQFSSDTGWKTAASHDLTAYTHYTDSQYAPCYARSSGMCTITSVVSYYNSSGKKSESVTSGNRIYDWSEDAGWWPKSDNRLGATSRFLEPGGPCVAASPTPTVTLSPTIPPTTTPVRKPGDANGDNRVDGLDYVIWLNHYGGTNTGVTNGDFNSDNRVDGLDYVIWLTNFNR